MNENNESIMVHRSRPWQISPLASNASRTQRKYAKHSHAYSMLLVSPNPNFGATLVEVLRQIDAHCEIRRTLRQTGEPFFVTGQRPSLIAIDAAAFPRQDGKALVAAIEVCQPRLPIVTFSNFDGQKGTEVSVDRGIVVHFTNASPRLLIEGVLRLIIEGPHYASHHDEVPA